jgi:hypothetical protein
MVKKKLLVRQYTLFWQLFYLNKIFVWYGKCLALTIIKSKI